MLFRKSRYYLDKQLLFQLTTYVNSNYNAENKPKEPSIKFSIAGSDKESSEEAKSDDINTSIDFNPTINNDYVYNHDFNHMIKDIKKEIIVTKIKTISWQKQLFKYIDEKGLDDRKVYKRAQIDRRLFSKIKSDENYHPSMNTVIRFSLSLELSLEEAEHFLKCAGYSLSYNKKEDIIAKFFFVNKIYDIDKYIGALYIFGCTSALI